MSEHDHASLLERYFFEHIDRRVSAEDTPLFTGEVDGEPLSAVVARDFSLSTETAEAAIEAARREVAL